MEGLFGADFEVSVVTSKSEVKKLVKKLDAEAMKPTEVNAESADNFLNISNETILLDVDVNIPSEPNFSLNFDIAWKDIVTDGVVLSADDNGEEKTLVTDIGEDLGTVTVALAELKAPEVK